MRVIVLALILTGCAPTGCRRESGMFGVFGQKYWSGYICRAKGGEALR